MSSQVQTATASVGATLGAVYIGSTIATILFGITNLQDINYYKKYPDDWWVYLYSVGILSTLDCLHVAFSTHAIYHYLVELFGDYVRIYHIMWSFKLEIQLSVAIIVTHGSPGCICYPDLENRHFGKVLPWFVVVTITVAFVYINKLLVMLSCRRDNRLSTNGGSSEPKVLRFTPDGSRTEIDEVV
ncbi:hypothetical protein EDD85DRAFT_961262 [Armillaria nabsnona]|nr:hypothetical protein EDD85DRAFT_961262 [Armillaria nabsnona]